MIVDLSQWQSLPIESIPDGAWIILPNKGGCYVAASPLGEILYVGKSKINLRARWKITANYKHHRLDELLELKAVLYWNITEYIGINVEKRLIETLKPRLNNTPVRKKVLKQH